MISEPQELLLNVSVEVILEILVREILLFFFFETQVPIILILSIAWLAPEVMKGESYTDKADIFSYGIVLWELLTHAHPYSEYPVSTDKFLTKFEQAIIGIYTIIFNNPNILKYFVLGGLRPTIPADTVPEFTTLITKCWDPEPSRRPSFDEMYHSIQSI